jgi:hypothetical protein
VSLPHLELRILVDPEICLRWAAGSIGPSISLSLVIQGFSFRIRVDPGTGLDLLEEVSKEELEKWFTNSLEDIGKTILKDKVYLLQISNGYEIPQVLKYKRDDEGVLPRGHPTDLGVAG